jgi:hypothetical protein
MSTPENDSLSRHRGLRKQQLNSVGGKGQDERTIDTEP